MRLPTKVILFALASAVLATIAACASSSSDASPGCASDPFACAAGQTCAPKDSSGTFACVASGSGAIGSACQNTPGVTTCGDQAVCLQTTAAGGQCVPYCDTSAHPCAPGGACRQAQLQGTSTTFFVCVGTVTPPADGGSD